MLHVYGMFIVHVLPVFQFFCIACFPIVFLEVWSASRPHYVHIKPHSAQLILELQSSRSELRAPNFELRTSSSELRAPSFDLRTTSSKLRAPNTLVLKVSLCRNNDMGYRDNHNWIRRSLLPSCLQPMSTSIALFCESTKAGWFLNRVGIVKYGQNTCMIKENVKQK